jgi:predicted nucleic acid-binding protein
MKALDTPVLLELLHDSPAAKPLLKSLRGEELACTELNLYELEAIAAEGPKQQRSAREAALARLRRRVTVLPLTGDAAREAARLVRSRPGTSGYLPLAWGALVAAGCSEMITTRGFAPPKGTPPIKVRIV